jgi:hypothetical protein
MRFVHEVTLSMRSSSSRIDCHTISRIKCSSRSSLSTPEVLEVIEFPRERLLLA